MQIVTPRLLTNIALNGCVLIREGHIDTLIRTLYEHFPNATLIGLRDMDYAVTSRAAKTTLICHTSATDSVALMHLLTLQETRGMHRNSTHPTKFCCGALLRSLGHTRETFWLMHCLTTGSCGTTGDSTYGLSTEPVGLQICKDDMMTRNIVMTAIRKDLDVFENPLFLNLAQGHVQTTETTTTAIPDDTGDPPPSEASLCRGPRIRLDLGAVFTATDPRPWARWGHPEARRRGIDQAEILRHMPARTGLQAHLERYGGHWEFPSTQVPATCAIGFVAHLTPMDIGRNPSAHDLVNLQTLEMWMRDSRTRMAHSMSIDPNQHWPPDLSEQPPPLSSRGGPP